MLRTLVYVTATVAGTAAAIATPRDNTFGLYAYGPGIGGFPVVNINSKTQSIILAYILLYRCR